MARMTLKPKTDRSTLLLCAGGGAFAVVATVALVGVVFTGSSLLGSVGAFTAVAAMGCLFGAFLPPGLMEGLVEKYRSRDNYHDDNDDPIHLHDWDDYFHNRQINPVYADMPGNVHHDPFESWNDWNTPPGQFSQFDDDDLRTNPAYRENPINIWHDSFKN